MGNSPVSASFIRSDYLIIGAKPSQSVVYFYNLNN